MQLNISNLCRGEGTMFFNLSIQGKKSSELLPCTVNMAFETKNGLRIPSMVFEKHSPKAIKFPYTTTSENFVVALPLIESSINVELTLNCEGVNPQSLSTTISKKALTIQARGNSLLNKEGVALLRSTGTERVLNRVVVNFSDYIGPNFDDGLLRGCAIVPQSILESENIEDYSLRCVNEDFSNLEAPVMFTPKLRGCSTQYSAPFYEIAFSARVPRDTALVTIYLADNKGNPVAGFGAIENHQLKRMEAQSAYMYNNAQWTAEYDGWFRKHRLTMSELALQREAQLPVTPKFSIVVPLYETPIELLNQMVSSVVEQTYSNWQLVLVNGSPANESLGKAVDAWTQRHSAIVAITLKENLGITLNTKAGIDQADGDFIGFLDHDDLLEPNALFEYAQAINENDTIDVLYCDEDKLLPDGSFAQGFLKPDYSPDLLLSNNYICHFLVIRSNLVRQHALTTSEFDGAQDYRLTLAVTDVARTVHHVPKVLYHWRIIEGSTAGGGEAKSYAEDAGKRAIEAALNAQHIDAEVFPAKLPCTYRVDYKVVGNPLVSIIIPNKDNPELLGACLESIQTKTTYENYEVLIVENLSTSPETFQFYETLSQRYPKARIVKWEGTSFNYAAIMNFGATQAKGDYFLLLNNDIEVITPNWIELLLGMAQRKATGIVGARLYYPDNTIQHAGVGITGETAEHMGKFLGREDQGYFGLLNLTRNVSCVTAACAMLSKDAFNAVEGFDERFSVAYNDVDLCLNLVDGGFSVVFNPYVELYHFESISRGHAREALNTEIQAREETALLHHKWAKLYATGDPYLNPNLNNAIPYCRYYNLGNPRPTLY